MLRRLGKQVPTACRARRDVRRLESNNILEEEPENLKRRREKIGFYATGDDRYAHKAEDFQAYGGERDE